MSTQNDKIPTVTCFISYAHDDDENFKLLINGLKRHTKHSRKINWEIWEDGQIPIGSKWHEVIQGKIENCDFAILLVSSYFLNSEYIKKEEFNNFLRKKREGFLIFPIHLSPCDFSQWPELAEIEFFVAHGRDYGKPDKEKDFTFSDLVERDPLTGLPLPNPNLERYYQNLANSIEQAFEKHKRTNLNRVSQMSSFFKVISRDTIDHPIVDKYFVVAKKEIENWIKEEQPRFWISYQGIDDFTLVDRIKHSLFEILNESDTTVLFLDCKRHLDQSSNFGNMDADYELVKSRIPKNVLLIFQNEELATLPIQVKNFLRERQGHCIVISPHSPKTEFGQKTGFWRRCHFREQANEWLIEQHHCDGYAKNFLFDDSKNKTEIEEQIEKFIKQLQNIINPIPLVGEPLIRRIEGNEIQRGKRFIRLFTHRIDDIRLTFREGEAPLTPLWQQNEFLYHEIIDDIITYAGKRIFLIVGEAGSGKTALCYFFLQYLIKEKYFRASNEDKILPIYLPFYSFRNMQDLTNVKFFSEIYTDLKPVANEVLGMIQRGKVLFIFDGMDEVDLDRFDLGSQYEKKLNRFIQTLCETYPRCPIIITSRSHFYSKNMQDLNEIAKKVLTIKRLTIEQQDWYIKSRLSKSRAEKTIQLIKETPNLFDLAPTPVLLEMIVTIAEDLDENEIEKFFGERRLKRKDIYEIVVKDWCDRHRERLVDKEDGNNLENYLLLVSLVMFHYGHHGGVIVSQTRIDEYLRKFKIDKDSIQEIRAKLKAIFSFSDHPLSDEDQRTYTFSHKTILEFLVAQSVLKALENSKWQLPPPFDKITLYHILMLPLDIQDDEIIEFIRELVLFDKNGTEMFKKCCRRLIDIIEQVDNNLQDEIITDEGRRNIRNNALKILAYLNDRDLSIQTIQNIPEPFKTDLDYTQKYLRLLANRDYSGINMYNCNFANHNLENVCFANAKLPSLGLAGCNLYNSDFGNSDLTGAYLGQSTAVWSLKVYNKQLLLDSGKGELALMSSVQGKRESISSVEDKIVWDIDVFCHDDRYYAIAGQDSNMISFFNLQTGQNSSFTRKFRETIFCVQANPLKNIIAYAGNRGNIYIIDKLNDILAADSISKYLESTQELEFPESYHNKHHADTVFGLVFSACGNYLVSCSSDSTVKYWNVEYLKKEHRLDEILQPEFFTTIEGAAQNRLRKIRRVDYNGKEYFVVGTQKGWIIVLVMDKFKFADFAIYKHVHDDWVLDLKAFMHQGETYLATVSGDHTACIWSFKDIIENQADAHPLFRGKYISSILSVATDENHAGEAENIYFGSYDGNIIGKPLKIIFNGDGMPLQTDVSWTRNDLVKEIDKLPESFVTDATNANITGVTGLNRGRLLLLKQRGAINWTITARVSNGIKEKIISYQKSLNEHQKTTRRYLFDCILNSKFDNRLELFLDELNRDKRPKLEALINEINTVFVEIEDSILKEEIINIYQMFTATKVEIASTLMVLYWLADSTWRQARKTSMEDFNALRMDLMSLIQSEKIRRGSITKERLVYEELTENVRKMLESYFEIDNRTDRIFDICFEDYQTNEPLRMACDYLGGEETNNQIPESLPKLNLQYLWTTISDSFWTGGSKIAKTYFDSFVKKIYKCCGNTHEFMIVHITNLLRDMLKQKSDRRLCYADFATGFNGTVICGVYDRLSHEEREKIEFFASDSSKKIVDSLKEKMIQNNLNIRVEVQNLANPLGYETAFFDVISQNLGGHHLSINHQKQMYKKMIEFLKPGGYLATGDVYQQPIKILAGLPDDIGAPEFPYDCRKLNYKYLVPLKELSGCFPQLPEDMGFYTCQIYQVEK